MIGFVYKWTNQIDGKWYIGSRKGTTDDGYRHSSKILAAAEKKYGIENFTREILFEGDYVKDKIRSVKEAEYLREEDAANNPMSYNQTNITGPDCFSEKSRQKMSKAHIGKKHSIESNIKRAASMIGKNKGRKLGPSWNTGLILSDEHKRNLSVSHTGKKLSESHKNNIGSSLRGIVKSKIICPHCNLSGGIGAMKRWHFENCPKK